MFASEYLRLKKKKHLLLEKRNTVYVHLFELCSIETPKLLFIYLVCRANLVKREAVSCVVTIVYTFNPCKSKTPSHCDSAVQSLTF